MSENGDWFEEIEGSKKYLFFCEKGIRSNKLVGKLRKSGKSNVYSLSGGLERVYGP